MVNYLIKLINHHKFLIFKCTLLNNYTMLVKFTTIVGLVQILWNANCIKKIIIIKETRTYTE